MKSTKHASRRQFLAASSGLVLAGSLSGQDPKNAVANDHSRLALEGGPKTVRESMPRFIRWGEPERERLNAMLGQDSLFYWKGKQTALLIDRFRTICPLRYVQTCSSGTAALHIAVAAAGIGPGDEVITSPITDIGTVIGVLYQQAVPVFADLIRNTYNLDPVEVERKITPRTRAIIAVHLFGNPCDLEALAAIAARHKLILIEDCAQAWGARYRGKPIGTVGQIACFSLQDSKQITCGDGGIVASGEDRIGRLLQRYGDKGYGRLNTSGLFDSFATNYRMSESQAAVAAAQLGRLDKIAARRSLLGNLVSERVADIPGIEPHQVSPDDRCTYWFYLLRLKPGAFRCTQAEFAKALAAEGAPASAGYTSVPLYGNPVFQKHASFAGRWPLKEMGLTAMDYTKVSCPEAEAILKTSVRLIVRENMSEDYVTRVAAAVRKVARHYAV
jgi:dTDP-4-amino-4,6-dideoxygalactose transaminase